MDEAKYMLFGWAMFVSIVSVCEMSSVVIGNDDEWVKEKIGVLKDGGNTEIGRRPSEGEREALSNVVTPNVPDPYSSGPTVDPQSIHGCPAT